MLTKIEPFINNSSKDFSRELENNIWVLENNLSSNVIDKNLDDLYSKTSNILCIQSPKITSKKIVNQLLSLLERKVRIYLLINEYTDELDALQGKALIRYGIQNKGTVLICDPNSNKSEGFFFSGGLTDEDFAKKYFVSEFFSSLEIKKLFKHFCYQFWEVATKEIIEKNKHIEVKSKPLDIFHNPKEYEEKDFVYGTLFSYHKVLCREDLLGKAILEVGNENKLPKEIIPFSRVELNSVPTGRMLPKDEFEAFQPELKDDNQSITIHYLWETQPFYLPENASKHSLYQKWMQEENKISAKVKELLQKIENRISYKNNNIEQFLLGKRNRLTVLQRSLDSILNQGNTAYHSITTITEINHCNQEYEQINREIDNKIEEIDLTNQINDLRSKIESKKAEISEKEKELAKTEDKFKGKIKGDINSLNKDINSLESRIQEKEKKKKNLQVIESDTGSALDFLIDSPEKENKKLPMKELVQYPTNLDKLPSVGKLYEKQGKTYLAISYWEEYEKGLEESERLQAILCVEK